MATELRRNGVVPQVIDRLAVPPEHAEPVGVQPRITERNCGGKSVATGWL